ncbi:MAG TPA: anti-sigma factor, partial [Chitinophagaceae bacterium]|nr:anti-sigma factor [Chitinophagaceae bacterium]
MLPEDEAAKIQQLSAIFPEVREELDRIAQSLEGIATVTAVTPPPELKDRIMGKLKSLKAEEDSTPYHEAGVVPFTPLTIVSNENPLVKAEEENGDEHKVIPIAPKAKRFGWLTAASVIGLLLSISAVIYLVSQNKSNENRVAALSQTLDTLNTRNREQESKILALSETMLMAENKLYKKIDLSALPGKQEALAKILWNTETHEVFVSDMSLPKAPEGKQYQLWAIVDGKPVDAGLLTDANKYLAQRMKTFAKADAFAISIE